uniref:RRM domain-containing protein n=1 Tax=Triticum urartu TaxID=4572 RepID=A0A8R7PJR6_TRIUA
MELDGRNRRLLHSTPRLRLLPPPINPARWTRRIHFSHIFLPVSRFKSAVRVRRSRRRIAAMATSTLSTVMVSNLSLKAALRDVKEFFSFSGDLVHVEMQSGDELSQVAYITFKDKQGAETAMLLTVPFLPPISEKKPAFPPRIYGCLSL